jgi:hypothetical protein
MRVTAALLASLEAVSHETTRMLTTLDTADVRHPDHHRETKRRVTELRTKVQELFDWLAEARLEEGER